jgi:hypothetical protein
VRSILRNITIIIIIVGAIWNVWTLAAEVSSFGPRQSNDIVVWENRFVKLRNALFREKHTEGKIGYETARSLGGKPPTRDDDVHWAELRFVAIPMLLVRNDPDTAYVLGDFTDGVTPQNIPENLIKVEDSGDGLVLFKRKVAE